MAWACVGNSDRVCSFDGFDSPGYAPVLFIECEGTEASSFSPLPFKKRTMAGGGVLSTSTRRRQLQGSSGWVFAFNVMYGARADVLTSSIGWFGP